MRIDTQDLSIVIPAYNEENNIITLLKKLDQQSLSGFNVIVVDDGSTDNTATKVEGYKPERFVLNLLKQENKGAAEARKNAIRHSSSKYIAVIDSDDGLADNSLEKSITPIISDPTIDISLFNLIYIDSAENKVSGSFSCYTTDNILNGRDVFANCIRSWGVHAFGIYNREMILSAYEIYNKFNKDGINYLNNDEVISRISFDLARKIFLSDGDYFFVNNANSTTRRVNHNYYKVLNNSFYLLSYIESKKTSSNYNSLLNDAYALIVSTIWGVSMRYLKWKKFLPSNQKEQWRALIRSSIKRVMQDSNNRNIYFTKKTKIQLTLLSIIF